MSYHLLMLHFENPLHFEATLTRVSQENKEVLNSSTFKAVMNTVSALNKKNFAQYFKIMATTQDPLLAHLMGLPEFVNIIRIRYFSQLKSMGYVSSLARVSFLKHKLHVQTDEEMELILTFMYGKKNKDLVLYSLEKDTVYLNCYTADVQELEGKVGKVPKISRSFPALKAMIIAHGKRQGVIKGSVTAEGISYVEHVHRSLIDLSGDVFPDVEEEQPEEDANLLGDQSPGRILLENKGSQRLEGSILSDGPSMKKAELMRTEVPSSKQRTAHDKLRRLEIVCHYLRRKVRLYRQRYLERWRLHCLAKNKEQAGLLLEYMDAKNDRVRGNCFFQWSFLTRSRQMLQAELFQAPFFESGAEAIDSSHFRNVAYLDYYSCFQTFVMGLMRQLLNRWFGHLCNFDSVKHNFAAVKKFEMGILYLVDSKEYLDNLASFIGVFMLDPEDFEEVLYNQRAYPREFILENWTGPNEVHHQGPFSLTIKLQVKPTADYSFDDHYANDYIVHYSTDVSCENQLQMTFDRYNEDLEYQDEDAMKKYYLGFHDTIRLCSRSLIKIRPHVEEETVDIESDVLPSSDLPWQPWNIDLNHVCFSHYLRIFLVHLNDIMDWVEKTYFKPGHPSIKVLTSLKQAPAAHIFGVLSQNLLAIHERRELILTGELNTSDEATGEYIKCCLDTSFMGFFFTLRLVESIVQDVGFTTDHQISLSPESNLSLTVDFLRGFLTALRDPSITNVYDADDMLFKLYQYVEGLIFNSFVELFQNQSYDQTLQTLDNLRVRTRPIIWKRIIDPIACNRDEMYRGNWCSFFGLVLEGVQDLLKLLAPAWTAACLTGFEEEFWSQVNFEDEYNECMEEWSRFDESAQWASLNRYDRDLTEYRINRDILIPPATGDTEAEFSKDNSSTQSRTTDPEDDGDLGKRSLNTLFSHSSFSYTGIDRILKL